MFMNLKYGARASAWASALMACPGLVYCGPTKAQLLEHHREHSKAEDWDARMNELEDKMAASIRRPVTNTDKTVYTGMEKSGFFRHEPELAQEMQLVKDGRGVRRSSRTRSTSLLTFYHRSSALPCCQTRFQMEWRSSWCK